MEYNRGQTRSALDDGIPIWFWPERFWVNVQVRNCMHFLVDGCIYLISFLVNDFQSSEGTSLTQNDEKGYWGVISEVEDGGKGSRDGVSSIPANKKIEIHGAVMVGWGLEPCSVGRFKMIEIDELLEDDDDDGEEEEDGVEEEEEYVEMSADAVAESANNLDSMLSDVDSALLDSSNPFDFPGAFE